MDWRQSLAALALIAGCTTSDADTGTDGSDPSSPGSTTVESTLVIEGGDSFTFGWAARAYAENNYETLLAGTGAFPGCDAVFDADLDPVIVDGRPLANVTLSQGMISGNVLTNPADTMWRDGVYIALTPTLYSDEGVCEVSADGSHEVWDCDSDLGPEPVSPRVTIDAHAFDCGDAANASNR